MEIAALREKLHSLIDSTPEDKLIEVYTLFVDDDYTDEFKSVLEEEYADYKKNGEVISKERLDTVIDQLMYGKK